MFLQRLANYADQLGMPPAGYQEKSVRYLLQINEMSEYPSLIDCASKERKQGIVMAVPDCNRSMNIRPNLLADNAEYVLGIAREGSKAIRVQKQHAAFAALVQDCADQTQEQAVQAVNHFLSTLDVSLLTLPKDFDPTARITFEVGANGIRPIDLPSVKDYWTAISSAGDVDQQMQCLVCGQIRPSVERLPIKIWGIPGGQSTGMALISANEAVFESYGLSASYIAPTCESCGQRFGNALNALLRDRETHLNVASLSYIFWAKEPMPFSLTSLLSDAATDEVRTFLQSPWLGHGEAAHFEHTPFYAAVLSARGPRIVLRDWMESTLDQVQKHLMHYFLLQHIIDATGKERWFPLWQLVSATVRRESKEEAAPQVGQSLLHFAFHGGVLPLFLLQQVVRRIRAEHDIYPTQAACLKMVLLSQPDISWLSHSNQQERNTLMTELDSGCPDPAYLCGRLLAVLEAVQYAALGDINATIVDRYYGAASSAPASVFGRLLRGAQPHLSRLQRDKPGAFFRLDRQLQEILEGFVDNQFPSTLNLLAQGRFALGYYHQKTTDRRTRMAASQNRQEEAEKKDPTHSDEIVEPIGERNS